MSTPSSLANLRAAGEDGINFSSLGGRRRCFGLGGNRSGSRGRGGHLHFGNLLAGSSDESDDLADAAGVLRPGKVTHDAIGRRFHFIGDLFAHHDDDRLPLFDLRAIVLEPLDDLPFAHCHAQFGHNDFSCHVLFSIKKSDATPDTSGCREDRAPQNFNCYGYSPDGAFTSGRYRPRS